MPWEELCAEAWAWHGLSSGGDAVLQEPVPSSSFIFAHAKNPSRYHWGSLLGARDSPLVTHAQQHMSTVAAKAGVQEGGAATSWALSIPPSSPPHIQLHNNMTVVLHPTYITQQRDSFLVTSVSMKLICSLTMKYNNQVKQYKGIWSSLKDITYVHKGEGCWSSSFSNTSIPSCSPQPWGTEAGRQLSAPHPKTYIPDLEKPHSQQGQLLKTPPENQ